MPTLTVLEIEDIRLIIGAPDCSDGSDTAAITNGVIQRLYDLATTNAPNASLTLPYTYVYLLQRMIPIYGNVYMVSRTTDHGDNERYTDPRIAINDRLKYWERIAGLSGARISTGTLNLALDTTEEWLDSLTE